MSAPSLTRPSGRVRGRALGLTPSARRGRGATRSGEAGETLIETLVTIMLLGLAVVGLLAGFVTVARLTEQNDRMTHAANGVQSFAEQVKQPVDDGVTNMTYQPCDEGPVSYPAFAGDLPDSSYTAQISTDDLRFASSLPTSGSGTVSWSSSCPGTDLGLQLVVVEVTVTRGSDSYTVRLPVIKRDARCRYSEDYENTDQGPC